MPRVPTYDNFQVNQNTLPQVRLAMPDAPTMPDVAGQQAQQMGQAMQQTGGKLAQIALAMQTEANRAREADAMNRLIKADTDLSAEASQFRGRNALERPGGKPLPEEYTEKLQSTIDEINNSLGNDAQKAAFKQQAAQVSAQFYRRVTGHFVEQQKVFAEESTKGRLGVALERIGALPDNEEAFAQSLGAVRASVDELTALRGGDQQAADLEFNKAADQAYQLRYKAWAQSNPVAALASFQANRGRVSPLMRERIADDLFRSAAPILVNDAKPWVAGVGSTPSDRPELAGEPRGVRNNNPGNIRQSSKPWQGEVKGTDTAYATFETPEAGIRAMAKNLLTYQDTHGLNTVSAIVSRWAPATENDTASYIATVAKAVGVKPDAQLNLNDPDTMSKIVKAMIRVENGKQPYTDDQIGAGINAAMGNGKLPSAQGSSAQAIAQPAWRDPNALTGNPIIDSLPPDQRGQLYTAANAQLRQDMAQRRDLLGSRADDAKAEYLTTGKATNPPTQAEFIQAYGQAEGVERFQEFQDVATLGLRLQEVKALPNADLLDMVNSAKPTPGDGFAQRQRNYEILQKAAAQTLEARQNDPIKAAMQNPAFGITPIRDFRNMNSLMAEVGKRKNAMDRISNEYGTPPTVLTNEEAGAFGAYLAAQQAPDKARLLGEFAAVAGEAGARSLSVQLKDKSYTLAIAATLAAYTTAPQSRWFGPDTPGANVGQMYLEGKDAIEQKRVKIEDQAEFGVKAEIYKAIDGVYQTPKGRDVAAEAAFGIYAKLKAEGIDDIERAVQLATGGVIEFNGAKIAKPWGWDDSRFEQAITETLPVVINDAGGQFIAGGRPISAADFAKSLPVARLQTYDQGSYLVMVGNDVVRNIDGAPYVLKVGE